MEAGAAALLLIGVVHLGCGERDGRRVRPYEYGPPRPVLYSVNPEQGHPGDTVGLVGAHFDPVPTDNIISFDGGVTTAVGGDTTTLTCVVPLGASSGRLTVTVQDRESNGVDFLVLGGHRILRILPDTGPVGTLVTIEGAGFSPFPDENVILFDWDGLSGIPTPALTATRTELSCYAPAGAETGDVVVTLDGVPSNALPYTYTTVRLTDVVPRSGVVTDRVDLYGENFSFDPTENVIRFDGTVAPCTACSDTWIQTEVPPGATGGHVTVESHGHESNGIFFCVWTPAPAAPTINSLTPDQGAYGDPVTIDGTGFAANTTDNEVRFAGILAEVIDATATSLDTLVPDGARTGPVTVRRGPEVATSPLDFTVTSPEPPPPTLDALIPAAAIQGESIVLRGTGFHPVPENNRVTFKGAPAKVLAAEPETLLVEVPFTASGVVTVRVGDRVSNGLSFSFLGTPAGVATFPFFGKRLGAPSNSVIFVVDLSLSMDIDFGSYVNRLGQSAFGTRLDVVRDRLAYTFSELPGDCLFNVVVYAGHPDTNICADQRFWRPTCQVATQANKQDATAWLNSWATWLWTATTMAVEAALQSDPDVRTLCLITDGAWTCPLNETNADQICRMFNANQQNAEIHTVAIQVTGGFSNLLRDISALTGGTFTSLDPPLGWPE
jgi:hypothetical protein